jgi:hypothetical protein
MSYHNPTEVLIHAGRVEQALDDDRGRLIGRYAVHRSKGVSLGLDDAVMHQLAKCGGYPGGRHRQLSLEQLLRVPGADLSGEDAQGIPGGYGMNVALYKCQ